jgi:thiosulfate/3-mercaptopyruvate sulfurtransferase
MVTLLVASCATKPTVVYENPARKMEMAEKINDPVRVTPETVVIDARSAFDYSMAHIPHAINLKWSDFTEPEPTQRGILQKDVFEIARRLARFGVSPDSRVVVVGRGLKGNGEEGRIAWMLAFLGVKNVQFADIDAFRTQLTNAVTSPPTGVPMWKPEPLESLNVSRDELMHVVAHHGLEKPTTFAKGQAPTLYRIIDVRTENEYLGREGLGRVRKFPDIGAINIPWTQFFTDGFRPNPGMRDKLKAVGITPDQRVVVIGNVGVASGAVTMALLALGYPQAGNYAGGWQDYLQIRGTEPDLNQ